MKLFLVLLASFLAILVVAEESDAVVSIEVDPLEIDQDLEANIEDIDENLWEAIQLNLQEIQDAANEDDLDSLVDAAEEIQEIINSQKFDDFPQLKFAIEGEPDSDLQAKIDALKEMIDYCLGHVLDAASENDLVKAANAAKQIKIGMDSFQKDITTEDDDTEMDATMEGAARILLSPPRVIPPYTKYPARSRGSNPHFRPKHHHRCKTGTWDHRAKRCRCTGGGRWDPYKKKCFKSRKPRCRFGSFWNGRYCETRKPRCRLGSFWNGRWCETRKPRTHFPKAFNHGGI